MGLDAYKANIVHKESDKMTTLDVLVVMLIGGCCLLFAMLAGRAGRVNKKRR